MNKEEIFNQRSLLFDVISPLRTPQSPATSNFSKSSLHSFKRSKMLPKTVVILLPLLPDDISPYSLDTVKPVTLAGLVVFKEESVRLRNGMEAEKDPDKKRRFRFNLKSAKFWERLLEGLVFVLLIAILTGCNTIEGARMDIHQWTDTPTHHK